MQRKNLTVRSKKGKISAMKRVGLLCCLVFGFLISCQNQGEPVQTGPVSVTESPKVQQDSGVKQDSANVEKKPDAPPVFEFDPASVSQEQRDTAMTEIQQLIQRLNGIIRARNYNAWVPYLDPNYFATISSRAFLDRISESAILSTQNIVLHSAEDYFNHVVVPSRANSRVDDIEFVSQNRVKAYIHNRGEKLILYELEKTGSEWKIIN